MRNLILCIIALFFSTCSDYPAPEVVEVPAGWQSALTAPSWTADGSILVEGQIVTHGRSNMPNIAISQAEQAPADGYISIEKVVVFQRLTSDPVPGNTLADAWVLWQPGS